MLFLVCVIVSIIIQTKFGDYPPVPYVKLLVVISLIVISGYIILSPLIYKELYTLFSFSMVCYFIIILFVGIELNSRYKNSLLDNEAILITTGEVYKYIDPRPPSLGYRMFSKKTPCILYSFKSIDLKYLGMHCTSEIENLPEIGENVEVEYSVERNDIFRLVKKK